MSIIGLTKEEAKLIYHKEHENYDDVPFTEKIETEYSTCTYKSKIIKEKNTQRFFRFQWRELKSKDKGKELPVLLKEVIPKEQAINTFPFYVEKEEGLEFVENLKKGQVFLPKKKICTETFKEK